MKLNLVFVACLCICMAQTFSKRMNRGPKNRKALSRIKLYNIDNFTPSMCNSTRHLNEIVDTSPWVPTGYSYRPGVAGLHTEIEHFNAYMMPTPTERALRDGVVKRVKSLVLNVWPYVRVQVFGSYRSRMFLPNSDIDMDISGVRDPFPLQIFEAKLLASDIAEPNSIVVIAQARVPVIKFIDRTSKHKVDITFDNKSGSGKIELVNELKRRYPTLQKLVMVLKQFLAFHKLNDASKGGIASFTLVLMCINLLQQQPAHEVSESANLGILLLEFLELYGRTFDYNMSCIRVTNGGQCLHKEIAIRKMIHSRRTPYLCAEDPLDPRINTAFPSYRAQYAKCAFENAFNFLSIAIKNNVSSHNGTLGRIVRVTKRLIEYRNWVHGTFNHTLEQTGSKNDVIY